MNKLIAPSSPFLSGAQSAFFLRPDGPRSRADGYAHSAGEQICNQQKLPRCDDAADNSSQWTLRSESHSQRLWVAAPASGKIFVRKNAFDVPTRTTIGATERHDRKAIAKGYGAIISIIGQAQPHLAQGAGEAKCPCEANEEQELIKFRQPRRTLFTAEIKAALIERLKPFNGTPFDIGFREGDGEQADCARDVEEVLAAARWN